MAKAKKPINHNPFNQRIVTSFDLAERLLNNQHFSDFEFTLHHTDEVYRLQFKRFMIYCETEIAYWKDGHQRCLDQHVGPHIPIFHFTRSNHHFVVPEFVLYRIMPEYEDWTWQPSVCLNKKEFIVELKKELYFGGWPKNLKGQELIPKRTGRMGVRYEPPVDSGWAVEVPGIVERIRLQPDMTEKSLDIQ